MDVQPTSAPVDRLHIICDRDVGLFNLVLTVLSHVHWAQAEGRIPIAYYTDSNCYWTPRGYQGRDTVWEYYFEPIVDAYPVAAIPIGIREALARKPPSRSALGYFVEERVFVSSHAAGPEVFGNNLKGHRRLNAALRRKTSALIRTHVRPRAYLRQKVEAFANAHFAGRFMIGVHIRGTDALADPNRPLMEQQPNFRKYMAVISRLIRRHPDACVFVASDAHASVDLLRQRFGERVVAHDSIRHEGGAPAGLGPRGGRMPSYLAADPDRSAQSGEEAIIEYLLLCRCHYLVHNDSNMARTVLLTMPNLPATNTIPAWLRLRRLPRDWQRTTRAVRETLSGQPLSSWFRLLHRRWIRRH